MLGLPIGSHEYASTFAERSIEEARRILKLITNLLLDRDYSGAAPDTGIFSPDEHNVLMRYTIRSKVTHLLRTLPPNTASQHFELLHSELLNSHLNVCPQSVSHESDQSFILSSPHLDVLGRFVHSHLHLEAMAFFASTLPSLHASTPTHPSTILSLISLSHTMTRPSSPPLGQPRGV